MENLKGLEEYLNDGCFIIVSKGLPHARLILSTVLKKYRGKNKIVSQVEGRNILNTLKKQSLFKTEPKEKVYKLLGYQDDKILMDELLQSHEVPYTLNFYKLSNKQYLSTICLKTPTGEYIPLQSIITDTILEGIQILNDTLGRIEREHPLQEFIEYQYYGFRQNFRQENASYIQAVEESIKGHQKSLGEKK